MIKERKIHLIQTDFSTVGTGYKRNHPRSIISIGSESSDRISLCCVSRILSARASGRYHEGTGAFEQESLVCLHLVKWFKIIKDPEGECGHCTTVDIPWGNLPESSDTDERITSGRDVSGSLNLTFFFRSKSRGVHPETCRADWFPVSHKSSVYPFSFALPLR